MTEVPELDYQDIAEAHTRETPFIRALSFIEWISASPVLGTDDNELTLSEISAHAEIEFKKIKQMIDLNH